MVRMDVEEGDLQFKSSIYYRSFFEVTLDLEEIREP